MLRLGFIMNEEFGSDFLTITDDEGNDYELEHIDTIEVNNQIYMAFLPADMNEDDEDFGLVILKVLEDDNDDLLVNVNDEDELNDIFERFIERLKQEDD